MPRGLTPKEAELVESCYFKSRYSGEDSLEFWKEIGHPVNDRVLYDFACALQDVESRVLAVLNSGVRIRVRKLILIQRAKKQKRRAR